MRFPFIASEFDLEAFPTFEVEGFAPSNPQIINLLVNKPQGGGTRNQMGSGSQQTKAPGQAGWFAVANPVDSNDFTYKGNSSDALTQASNDATQRTNPIADYTQANADAAQGALAGQSQTNSLGYLANAASGQGPSAASAQFQQSLGAAQNAQASAANSARGGGLAMASAERNAAQTMGAQTIQGANQASQLRANEMINAQNAYAQGSTSVRNSITNAQGQDANQALAQANLGLQGRQENDATALAYSNQANDAAKSTLQGTEGFEQQIGVNTNAANSANMASEVSNANNDEAMQEKVLAAGAAAASAVGGAAMSDARVKMKVKPAEGDVRKFLDAMSPKNFEYKSDPGTGHTGIMAQDLEKSKMGSRLVTDTPSGKMVETGNPETMTAVLASMAELNKRLKAIEGKKSSKGAK